MKAPTSPPSPPLGSVASSPLRHHHKLLLYLFVAIPLIATGTKAVKVHSVEVPNPAISGEDIQLECKWSAGVKGFYSIRWYKDGEQIYSYIPQSEPVKVDHNLPGVNVMLVTSDRNVVTLRRIDLSSEGTYRCEVMSEAPTFEVDYASANLTVVEMPKKPVLGGMQNSYTVGDTLRVNCSVPNSRPAAEIYFLVNGIPIPPNSGWVRPLPTTTSGGDGGRYSLSTASSVLTLPLGKSHLSGITVVCQAKVHTLSIEETGYADVLPQQTAFSFFNAGVPRVCPPTAILMSMAAALTLVLNT